MGYRKLTYYQSAGLQIINPDKELTPTKRKKNECSAYFFGFNGQEMDNEVSGTGNSLTAESWQYDSRLGRRWNIDPMSAAKPWMSPYHAFSNKPITNADPNGAYDDIVITGPAAADATTDLDNSSSLSITRDASTGKLSATGTAVTKYDKTLLQAINDPDITVGMIATYSGLITSSTIYNGTSIQGVPYNGGAFLGNTITETYETTKVFAGGMGTINIPTKKIIKVNATQEVNPSMLRKLDCLYDKCGSGKSILHEATEAYKGALNSKASGNNAPPAINTNQYPNSAYDAAHAGASPQPGDGVVPSGYGSFFYDLGNKIKDYKSKGIQISPVF